MTEEREQRIRKVLHNRQADLCIVLENVDDPHNIMAVSRSCDAVGIQEIHVVKSKTIDQFQGRKSSSSANKWVDFKLHTDIHSCYSSLRKHGFKILCTHLTAEAKGIHDTDFCEKVAIVFGNEKDGVSEEALNGADGNLVIPQVGMIKSLNISVACAVTLYEAYRQRENAGFYSHPRLNDDELKSIFDRWSQNKTQRKNGKDHHI